MSAPVVSDATGAAAGILSVALIGNPNVGKSTLFGALAGVRQRTGNYPGVTVEKKLGRMKLGGRQIELIDLPGTYSLAPRSPDEMVTVDVLLGRQAGTSRPQAVICIVDASNIERNLYLVSQVLELGLPTVLVLNMVDVVAKRGITLDIPLLRSRLGLPVVAVEAHRRRGLDELKQALSDVLDSPEPAPRITPFPAHFSTEVEQLTELLNNGSSAARPPRYLVERLLLDSGGYIENAFFQRQGSELREAVTAARKRLQEAGTPVPAVEAMARYGWVAEQLSGAVTRPTETPVTLSDRMDRILTHRFWGTVVFVLLMVLVFQSVFSFAAPFMDAIDALTAVVGESVGAWLPEGPLHSLIVDGVIAGVGGVIIFLPQIFILFFFIAVLEDCGYMARAAYLMDRLMVRVGLSGKSFVPMLSSFACAIPGIMATRVIENSRDRLTTILVAPLMSCSARLPVYLILIAAFIPSMTFLSVGEVPLLGLQGLTMFAMYCVGIVTAVIVALILKRTILRGPTPSFVMELPAYKWPSAGTVLHRMLERGWIFVRRAGTLIVAVSILVWASLYFPRLDTETVVALGGERLEEVESELEELTPVAEEYQAAEAAGDEAQLTELQPRWDAYETLAIEAAVLNGRIDGAQIRNSYLGRVGRAIEPVVKPLGWDWRIGSAAIASFPAREVVISTLAIIYELGSDFEAGEESEGRLTGALQAARWYGTDRPVFNIPVALSVMVFFALCAQCVSTLAIMQRETNSWKWPAFAFTYMTVLAYLAALVVYQVGMLIAGEQPIS